MKTTTQAARDAAGAWYAWRVAQLRADHLLDHALRLADLAGDGKPADPQVLDAVIASAAPGCTCRR